MISFYTYIQKIVIFEGGKSFNQLRSLDMQIIFHSLIFLRPGINTI